MNTAHWIGELIVVLTFAAGWGVLELVISRMERRRRNELSPAAGKDPSAADSGHAKRQ